MKGCKELELDIKILASQNAKLRLPAHLEDPEIALSGIGFMQ